jgi:hypothetical protein
MIRDRTNVIAKEKQTEKAGYTLNGNIVYVSPDAVLKKNDQTVSLRDEKRKIRLELKKELNEEKLVVWDEQDGGQMNVDKVIFNDLPAEWIEGFIQPGTRVAPPPEMMAREQEVFFRMHQDSLHQWQNRIREESEFFKQMQNMHERKPGKPGNSFTVRLQRKQPKDSLLNKVNIFPPGSFSWNESFPEEMIAYHFSKEEFQKYKQEVAAVLKQQRLQQQKAKLYYRQNQSAEAENEKVKERFKSAPVFAYMNDLPRQEEVRLNEERISIIIENNKVFINEMNIASPDSLQMMQQPHQPKRVIRRLEVIRL